MKIFYYFIGFLLFLNFPSNTLASEKLELGLKAYNENNIELGDYFISPYLAEEGMSKELYQKILDLYPPTSFISGYYSDEFLSNFQFESWMQWRDIGNNNIEHKVRMLPYEAIENNTNQYSVIWAKPQIRTWSIIGGRENIQNIVVTGIKEVIITFGILNKDNNSFEPCNSEEIEIEIQRFYKPRFVDVDFDGIKEIIFRYNISNADGYTQEMRIYKHGNTNNFCSATLFQSFKGINGYANFINNNIEVANQISKENESWLESSEHEIINYTIEKSTVKVLQTKKVSNINW